MNYYNNIHKIILMILVTSTVIYANKFALIAVDDILVPIAIDHNITDTNATDSNTTDTNATDSNTTDTNATDCNTTDTNATDSNTTDDTNATDSNTTDDTNATDSNTTDTNATSLNKPLLTLAPPTTTTDNNVSTEIQGKVGSTVFINGNSYGTIDSSGKKMISLDTSGDNGKKSFIVVLEDPSSHNLSDPLTVSLHKSSDEKFNIVQKGLTLYQKNMPESNYKLEQLSDAEFTDLSDTQKLQVSNTIFSTLFFGYPQQELLEKINTGDFISNIRQGLEEERTDRAALEARIRNNDIFKQFTRYSQPQVLTILTRFYAMKELDSYFIKNWVAYILTQTIMFSPAYELESTHNSNISNVFNRILTFQDKESSMKYLTYMHMMSQDNWRRFRSPEDNGREMLEIFHFDMNDTHVPLAAKALKNWRLNLDGDTLEIGRNDNVEPIELFGTTIKNGEDFYRELVKSSKFTNGATKRLVDFFFPNKSEKEKTQITTKITSSNPGTWQDILLQIIFSKEYLLHNKRAKSTEEEFFSLTKKMNYKHYKYTFYYLKNALSDMHQASMKYKLGKLNRVPLDALSFAHTHKYLREELLLRDSRPDVTDDYTSWSRHGWDRVFIASDKFTLDENDPIASLNVLINYLFQTLVYREANAQELEFFKNHMIYEDDKGNPTFYWAYNMFQKDDDTEKQTEVRAERRINITRTVLDYISRLDTLYLQKEVK